MKLAVISARYPNAKTEAYLGVELALLARQCDAMIVAPANGAGRAYYTAPVPVMIAPLRAIRTYVDAASTVARAPQAALAAIRDILCARGTIAHRIKNVAVIPTALALARRFRAEGIDCVHAYWMTTAATIAYIVSRTNGIPFSATAHRFDIYDANARSIKVRAAGFVRAISDRGARDLRAAIPEGGTIRVMRIGVQIPPEIAPRTRVEGRIRLLCAAELLPVKDHATLVDAIARATAKGVDVRCDLAGEGPLRVSLQSRIVAAGLSDRIRLRGNVPHDELLAAMHAGNYDAAVLSSLERGTLMEGIPVALMEAMARGLPCIATTSGSIPELLSDGCGALVPPEDPVALAENIARLAGDPGERASIGDAGRRRVERDFNIERTVETLYAALVALTAVSEARSPR